MKNIILSLLVMSFCTASFSADLAVSKKKTRGPANKEIKITGTKAETLFRATLAADENVIDNCTAHTCSFTTRCEYDQTAAEKYVCTVAP